MAASTRLERRHQLSKSPAVKRAWIVVLGNSLMDRAMSRGAEGREGRDGRAA